MNKIDLKALVTEKNPKLFSKLPKFLTDFVFYLGNKIFKIDKINKFIADYKHLYNNDYIDQLYKEIGAKYIYNKKELENIPAEGPLIIVSNHPLGGLDGTGIVRIITERRPDAMIVVNDLLGHLDNLKGVFFPIDLYNVKNQRSNLLKISAHLKENKAIIFFPAGKVSRMKDLQVIDTEWNKGAVTFARKFKTPISTVHIKAKNSLLFYFIVNLYDTIAPFLLPREMFNSKGKKIKYNFGKTIKPSIFEKYNDDNFITMKLKEYIYNLKNPPLELKEFL